jgi:hypothetical protein
MRPKDSDRRDIHLVEDIPPLMSGTEANHPLVVDPDGAGKPVVLAPQPTPMASNYLYEHLVTWRAEYEDGRITHQAGELGTQLSTDHLSREGLRRFILVDNKSGKDIIGHDFELGDMFFYRRRTAMRPGEDVVEVIHILGKTRSKEGPNEIFFVFETDKRIEDGDFNDPQAPGIKNPWRYPLSWHDADLTPIT